MRWLIIFAVGVLLATGGYFTWQQRVEIRLVDDQAGLIGSQQRDNLVDYHQYLLDAHRIDCRVITRTGVGNIELFANRFFREQLVGDASDKGRGLLLVIDPLQDEVRLEVGASLEGVFVDAFVAYIERDQMVPFFRANRVADGIVATSEMIITRAQNARDNKTFQDEVWMSGSTGAGATSDAGIGKPGKPGKQVNAGSEVNAGSTPGLTLAAYADAMSSRNLRPDLAIYSNASRAMLANWLITPAQADNAARSIKHCGEGTEFIGASGSLAVIRYAAAQRQCNPYFFRLEAGQWRLDFTMMQDAIRFGASNSWHFVPGVEHPYSFAFSDWKFDRNGYPMTR